MAKGHKQHHTVPESYLRGFASNTGRRPQVNVLDLERGKWRRQSPGKVCRENRFYAVDLPDLDENLIETEVLGRLESAAAPLIRRISREAVAHCREGRHPPNASRDDFELLACFVAMMHVRSSASRRQGLHFGDALGREMLLDVSSDSERFDQVTAEARAAGVELGDISREPLRAAAESEDFTAEFNTTLLVALMLDTWKSLVEDLLKKTPSLLVAGGRVGLLVTSDRPVSVYEKGGIHQELKPYRADIRDRATGVLMPLTPEVVLRYDADLMAEVRPLSRQEVATFNSATALGDASLVVAATREFCWWSGDQIRGADAFLEVAKVVRAEMREMSEDASRAMARELVAAQRHPPG